MKVIAFSLWGDNPIYTIGAIRNADLAEKIYPGWVCRYYIGASTPLQVLDELESKNNTQVIRMTEAGNWTGMFWRFDAASDPTVSVMVSRDTDSRLNAREKAAVDDWLSSGKGFHIMRDHPHHKAAILGGMWGARNGVLRQMNDLLEMHQKMDSWQVDQLFLRDVIYPLVKDNALVHDEFFARKPFPTKRIGKYFVGQAFDQKDEPLHPEHMDLL